ncbi:hypothetical protein AcV5_000144 [Taiwanofungus camphoratus]|nr:hypothetical protein AcV5_000144 [Antrodia cinnamomea]KAI0945012.1 hypothetical protein AcV7_001659 [Antrodia cinnamomea]
MSAAWRLTNIEFVVGDAYALAFPDGTFDVVHAYQVLQHVPDSVRVLREIRRVAKPGGLVAVRESDFSKITWSPDVDGLADWQDLHMRVARSLGGEPDAGRRLVSWAMQAGFDRNAIDAAASAWCSGTPEEQN